MIRDRPALLSAAKVHAKREDCLRTVGQVATRLRDLAKLLSEEHVANALRLEAALLSDALEQLRSVKSQ